MRLILLIAILFAAASTHAATISVVSSGTIPLIGDLVTLSIVGDAEGASSSDVFVQLVVEQFSGLEYRVDVLNQSTGAIPLAPDGLFYATVEILYGGGVVNVSVDSSTLNFFGATFGGGTSFGIAPDFFDAEIISQQQIQQTSLSGAHPWATSTLTYQVVPEPASSLLVGLGLMGLALTSRKFWRDQVRFHSTQSCEPNPCPSNSRMGRRTSHVGASLEAGSNNRPTRACSGRSTA